ncbi:MAG: phosphoribosylamine--glycine ligase [Candidatus Aminicenantes bacterium]|nr:MAG: phosphoribosylamine--glycine ligase [Candidatus Aminicenantes bacterium]
MKILVVGSGGREHALVWKIAQSKRVDKIYAAPGNAGMKDLAELVDVKASNTVELGDFAQDGGIDLTVVGPEMSLALGIVDEFRRRNLKIYGPTQKAATIESSKAFAKSFMKKNGIPTAPFQVFDSSIEAINYIRSANFPLVVKADGLAGGKGVFVCKDIKDAEESIRVIMLENKFGKSGERVVVEEFLEGTEMSFMAVSDGKRALPLVTSMDYKKAYENDKGPNTGGMGAISPAPQINNELYGSIMKSIIYPTIEGLKFEGKEFRGTLYAGLMITDSGPQVLEFNVRFGDPEIQPVLMRMKSDLVDLLEGAAEGNLFDVPAEWDEKVSGCVVLASKGYPVKYNTNKKIEGLERAKSMGVEVFHAGTIIKEDNYYTAGGRVLNVCTTADSLKDAMKKIYDAISFISFDNIYFRQDIGRKSK